MECRQVTEFLPWFANGSLAADEAEAIQRHLDGCEACRRELRDTGAAFEIFGEHLPTATLVGLAFDGDADPVSRAVAESHLEGCSECLEQLAFVRRSRQALKADEAEPTAAPALADGGRVARFPAPGSAASTTPWRSVALAASIAAVVSTSGWIWTWQGGPGSAPAASFRGEGQAGATSAGEDRGHLSLRERLAGSQARGRDRTPRTNVPVVRIGPRRPAAPDDEGAAAIPAGAGSVVLVLDSGLGGDAPLDFRLEAADGSVVWRGAGLERQPRGGYALSFSTAGFESGRYTLSLLGADGQVLESYPLSID